MPLIGPDMSDDMCLGAVSWEAAGSDGPYPLAVGMSGRIGCSGAEGAAATAAYVAPPSAETRCRPPEDACSPVEFSGISVDPAQGV
jgi:hypothetical protein